MRATSRFSKVVLAIALAVSAGCEGEIEKPFAPADPGPGIDVEAAPPGTLPGTEPEPTPIEPTPPAPSTQALLEVHALDIWAQPLPASASVKITRAGQPVTASGFPLIATALEVGDYEVEVSAPEHESMRFTVHYDGSNRTDALIATQPTGSKHGLALSRGLRALAAGQPEVPVYTLFTGLRHKWFSASGRPARRGNDVTLLMDGDEAWRSVHADLTQAKTSIHMSTWWWESDFELIRDPNTHMTQTTTERAPNTIMKLLEASPATKRIMVGQFLSQDGIASWMTVDAPLRYKGAAANDKFEFMGQANETAGVFDFKIDAFEFSSRVRGRVPGAAMRNFDPERYIESTIAGHRVDLNAWPIGVEIQHASYHQKFLTIDSDLTFIGGMNLRRVDWDTSAHKVFEARRMLFDAPSVDRLAVAAKDAMPDSGPRKDYMVRVKGPAAQDAGDVFKRRWDETKRIGSDYAANASSFTVSGNVPAVAVGSQVQVTTTMPEPFWEHSIAETWMNAVANAERFIYIEDQYFRAPMLVDAIVKRMQAVPALRLVVFTKPVSEWVDPGCAWTAITHSRLKALFPARYLMLKLMAFDIEVTWGWDETEPRYQDMDVHSKMFIVDDRFMSVGSANKNNRGMIYEAEMNVAVFDPLWVRNARRRVFANILPPGTPASDDVGTWWTQMKNAASYNQDTVEAWSDEGDDISLDGAPLPTRFAPKGFIYPLDFRDLSECLIESIGPDMV